MCTLILAHQVFEHVPVFLASNRDELLNRPSSGPRLWEQRNSRFVAPRDEQEGGTWLGVNEWGVLVAITNRFGDARDPTRRSRGNIVLEALTERYADVAVDGIAALPPELFNPFHLLIVDRRAAHVVWSDGAAMHRESLDPGVHVITERSYGAADNGRAAQLNEQVQTLSGAGELTPDRLTELLKQRDDGNIDVTNVLLPEMNYGTRSSTIVELGDSNSLRFSAGPPATTAYEDFTPLLHEVLRNE